MAGGRSFPPSGKGGKEKVLTRNVPCKKLLAVKASSFDWGKNTEDSIFSALNQAMKFLY